jgi:hypothetical protein
MKIPAGVFARDGHSAQRRGRDAVCLLNKDTAAAVNSLLDDIVAKVPQ